MTAAAAALLVAVNEARKLFRVSAEHSVMTVAAIIVVSSMTVLTLWSCAG